MKTNRGNTSSAHATYASPPTKQPQNSVKYDNLQGSNSRCEYSTYQTFQWYCYYYGMCIYICFVKCFLGNTSSGNTSSVLDLHILKF